MRASSVKQCNFKYFSIHICLKTIILTVFILQVRIELQSLHFRSETNGNVSKIVEEFSWVRWTSPVMVECWSHGSGDNRLIEFESANSTVDLRGRGGVWRRFQEVNKQMYTPVCSQLEGVLILEEMSEVKLFCLHFNSSVYAIDRNQRQASGYSPFSVISYSSPLRVFGLSVAACQACDRHVCEVSAGGSGTLRRRRRRSLFLPPLCLPELSGCRTALGLYSLEIFSE